jgi:hypothetical protein
LNFAFRNFQLEDLRYLTEKGADDFVRYTKNNSVVHFPAVPYSVDIIKLLLGKRTSVKLTKIYDKNPHHILAEFGNLETRKDFFILYFFLLKRRCFEYR